MESAEVINPEEDRTVDRRESKRRGYADRRSRERTKRIWLTIVLPTVIGVLGTSLVAWGAYVTHTTYGISAKYEETFVSHIEEQKKRIVRDEDRLMTVVEDYNGKIVMIHSDMNAGFKELRDSQADIYRLLLEHQVSSKNKK